MIEFPELDGTVTVNRVERYLGYPPLTSAPKHISQMIATELGQVKESIKPKAGFEIFTSKEISSLFVSNKLVEVNPSKQVYRFFEVVEKIAIYVGTVGFGVEKKLQAYSSKKESSRARILEAVSIVAVKDLVEQVEKQIKGTGGKLNFYCTPTFIPGVGEWGVGYRKHVLELLSGYKIGISLDDNLRFIPQFSTAGIVGWTKKQKYIEYIK